MARACVSPPVEPPPAGSRRCRSPSVTQLEITPSFFDPPRWPRRKSSLLALSVFGFESKTSPEVSRQDDLEPAATGGVPRPDVVPSTTTVSPSSETARGCQGVRVDRKGIPVQWVIASRHRDNDRSYSGAGRWGTTGLVVALEHAIEHAAHLLPAQGPITVFVHHNTLHAFEELPVPRGRQEGVADLRLPAVPVGGPLPAGAGARPHPRRGPGRRVARGAGGRRPTSASCRSARASTCGWRC